MKFTVTVEQVVEEGERLWLSTVAEFPDVRVYETDAAESASIAVIVCEDLASRRAPQSPEGKGTNDNR